MGSWRLNTKKRGWHLTFQELINPWPSNLTVLNLLETISRSKWKFGMLVFWERRKLGGKGNQQQTQTTYDINNGTWSWITLVGGRCFQCWTIPVPPMCRKSSINSPLLIISPSPRHLPSYDKLYWLNTTVTLHVDWSDMACWRAGSTDFILFYTILIFHLWLHDLPTSCTWSFSLSIVVLYEELIPSSLLN